MWFAVPDWLFSLRQDALEVAAYGPSQQARAAEDLFDAYRSGDGEAVKKCIASSAIFGDLDNQVGPLLSYLLQVHCSKPIPGQGRS
jgi:hypothetical protein